MRDGDTAMLDRCALLLRLAEDLERSRDQLVQEVHVHLEEEHVRLNLQADGDVRVARWAAGRETELFRRAYGRALAIAPS
jgi:exopolyphosphatase/guanosine-5'-triphosphate,3'-diphosphate pyrophosphatase